MLVPCSPPRQLKSDEWRGHQSLGLSLVPASSPAAGAPASTDYGWYSSFPGASRNAVDTDDTTGSGSGHSPPECLRDEESGREYAVLKKLGAGSFAECVQLLEVRTGEVTGTPTPRGAAFVACPQ